MKFKLYTDGGCSGNRRDSGCPGGYGYLLLDPSMTVIVEGGGKGHDTTNNQMEMMAVIKGLRSSIEEMDEAYGGSKKHDCIVITDSRYVCDNYTDYVPTWKKNGWRKANGSPVLNISLWKQIDSLTPEFKSFDFRWVKGHARDPYNNRVDEIAGEHMKS